MAFSPHHTSHHTSHIIGILTTSHIITSHHIRHHKPKDAISPHHTSHIIVTSDITSHHITHHKPKEENTKKKFLGRVLGPDGILTTSHITSHVTHHWHSHHITHHHISPHQTSQAERRNLTTSHITHHCDIRHHISPYHTSQAERREHKEEVLGPSSWAGWHSHTSQAERREHKEEVLGPSSWAGWHSHHITHHHISPHQTSQAERAKKYEFYCENVVQEHPRTTKSTRITTKNEHRRS